MSRRRESGFSMVEVLIALAVGAIVITGMYQAFNILHKWWISDAVRSDMRQNARAGLETLTRDLEMAGYQITTYGDPNKRGIAITFASLHEIEMDEQRPDNSTISSANVVYEPRLVYYHLATDMRTGRQHLYRQIRTQPGLSGADELVAENISVFNLYYFDKDNAPVAGLPSVDSSGAVVNPGGSAAYIPGVAVPATSPLRAIRRIQVTLTTIPAGATTLTVAVTPADTIITVASTIGFPSSGRVVVFETRGGALVGEHTVSYTDKDDTHFIGASGVPDTEAGSVVARPVPIGVVPKPLTLTASVIPPNLATADEVTADVLPPDVPTGPTVLSAGPPAVTGPAVIDTRSCIEKLRVRWNPNTEPDLAGYILFYGATGSFTVPLRAIDKSDPRITLNPTNLLVTKCADKSAAPNSYAIQVAAYDSSGNISAKSAAVSGNPSPDVTSFTASPFSNDTTVNPGKPSAPTGLTVVPGADAGELVVSWLPPGDESATAGYRLYRSTSAFGTGHIDHSLQLRGESSLTPAVTTWTDKNRESCVTYHYAVASIGCDETLADCSPYTISGGDYSVASGEWRDATLPPAPGLAGTRPEQQRILITLTNPLAAACPDFDRTEIFWSKAPAAAPHLDGTVVLDGTPLPVRENAGGNLGTFRMRGSQVITFDREAETDPASSLVDGDTYTILAVSYDRCGNVSATASTATLTVPGPGGCTDDPPGPPPASFANGSIALCPPSSAVIRWEYPDQVTIPDLAGFRVARTGPGGDVLLTDGPTLLTSWTDTDPLAEGATYTYTITATDCAWEEYLRGLQLQPYPDSLNTLTIGPVSPGELQRYEPPTGGDELAAANFVTTVSDVPAAHTYHNNVKFSLQNPSQSKVTIKRMAVSWDNPNVVLDRVVIGGSPSDTPAETISVGGIASGAGFSVNTLIEDHAGVDGSPSGPVPVLLRFTTPSGSVNRLANMRSVKLELSLWVGDHTSLEAECPTPTAITIDVPRGPVLGGFSQSAPGRYGIDSYEVVGPSGTARDTDIKVPYGIPVNVYGVAFDNSRELFADGVNRGFATLEVVGISAAAYTDVSVTPAMPTSGTFFHLPLQSTGGDRYTIYRTPPVAGDALMPEESDKVVWYYALGVDKTGNWDRVPDPDSGNYAYFQPPFDVCTVSPAAPVLTLASSSSTGATLTWAAPTTYDNGIAIVAADPLTYDVYIKNMGVDPWSSVPAAANISGTSFSHAANLLAGTYYYMVRAKNSCSAGARSSGDSNVVAECVGAAGLDCSLFSVPATVKYGDPVPLSVRDFCAFKDNNATDSIVFSVTSGAATTDFTTAETGDSGTFAKTISAVYSGGGGDQVLAPSGSLSVSPIVAGTTACAARTVTLTGGPCPTTPKAPVMGSATRTSTSSSNPASTTYTLTFTAPTQNTDNTPLLDLAGYRLLFSTSNTAPTTFTASNSRDVGLITSPASVAGLPYTSNRYYFWMQAYDSCGTRRYSANSPSVRANQ